ncbi:MAG TPA: 2-oxoacid:acceptor oxidoreductase subunit alpha [Candidatus Woesebacteria bacterium]|nr:2-oxoacid:acceptor oxidoreductase subunit alpha [Candidatus Woesebacteria bacterium]HNS94583.1 2-oxoacid:acceptor oxidoreductase subunit alpha [Candidatus Woesebacteria bacterium]
MQYSWKISGEAGFGITTVGLTFSKICARHGLHVFDYAEFPSLIRGGFTTYEVTLSTSNIGSLKETLDMLVCLRQDGFDRDKHRLTPQSVVLFDQDTVEVEGDFVQIPLPLKSLRTKHKAFQVMVNTISLGATLALNGWNIQTFYSILEEEFGRKGQEIIDHNKILAQEGWDYVTDLVGKDKELQKKLANSIHANSIISSHSKPLSQKQLLLMTGNEAFSLASVVADCRGYFAYPMSPASTVLTTLASWAKHTKMVVRHVEDEIAVISEALGCAYAGVRSSVGTSGGGFALMVESLSYAGVAEIPLVVYVAQRPGPATGLPTWTGQGDLLFAVHAGHGEFPKIVLAAGDIQEMIEITTKAYDLADTYQVPVIVLADKLVAESHATIDNQWFKDFTKKHTPKRGKLVMHTDQNPYLRYKDSPDGISEYLIPGMQKGHFWQANSYEHVEDSHTTEDAEEVVKQVEKRARKLSTYLNSGDYQPPLVFGDIQSASIIFVSYGSNKKAILQAQTMLQDENIHNAYIHFTHVYPLSETLVKPLFDASGIYVLIENNSEGQLDRLLKSECNIDQITHKLLKYDGRPIFAHEIVTFTKNLIQ